jgi:hypothetical protein
VEVAVEEFFVSKDREWFYQAFKELAEKWVRPLNMRVCILNIELLLFCMICPIKLFISNPTLFMGHPQYYEVQDIYIVVSASYYQFNYRKIF